MIEAGEPLGTRYVVVRPVSELHAGVLFEVADHSGMQYFGQLLHGEAVSPQVAAEVRQSVVTLPALPAVLRPRDLALTSRALPVALLERPGGVALVSTRLDEIITALGKREATTWLFRQIAGICNDLAQAHQMGTIHGAIRANCLVCASNGDAGNLQLAGFGINPFARGNDPAKIPSRRADLVDLLTALNDLFAAGGLAPEGGAAAKWMLLRTSAQHGEHPALASGTSLAAALTEMASLRPDDNAPRSVRAPTLAPPTRASSRPPTQNDGGGRKAMGAGRRGDGAAAAARGAARPESTPPPRAKVRFAVVVPAVLLIMAVVVAGVVYLLHAGDDIGVARLNTPTQPRDVPLGECSGETPDHLEGITDFQAPAEFDAVCLSAPDRVALFGRKGTAVVLTTRVAQRGQHFSEVQPIAQVAVELGTALAREGTLWTVWRNGINEPFTLARIEGGRTATVPVPLARWDSVPLRGAWLVDVGPRNAWLVTNVLTEGGAHVVLLQITFGPAEPDVIVWLVSPGVAESVIPGDAPAVLVHQRPSDGGSMQHAFTDVTLNLANIATARRPVEAQVVRGAPLPDNAVTRSAQLSLDGAALGVVRHGVSVGAAHAWLIARGGVRPTDTCAVPERCHTAGPVAVVSFAPGRAPAATQVIASGWATDIATAADGLRVVATSANIAGAEVPFHTMYSLATPTAPPSASRVNLTTGRSARVRLLACGREPWVIFDATQPGPILSALPQPCVRGR